MRGAWSQEEPRGQELRAAALEHESPWLCFNLSLSLPLSGLLGQIRLKELSLKFTHHPL